MRIDFQGLAGRDDHGPLDQVFQFAHVAGPVIFGEQFQGRRPNLRDRLSEAVREVLEEVANEIGNVLGRLRSGGTRIAKTCRRKNKSARNLPASLAASKSRWVAATMRTSTGTGATPDPLDGALLQRPQEHHCVSGVSSPTSSRKRVPWCGQLEAADPPPRRAGEGALLVAEQLADDDAGGERGAVDGDEQPLPARAELVDRPRDQLLARAGLAEDQHGAAGRGDLPDRRTHRLHRPALAGQGTHVPLGAGLVAQIGPLAPEPLQVRDARLQLGDAGVPVAATRTVWLVHVFMLLRAGLMTPGIPPLMLIPSAS